MGYEFGGRLSRRYSLPVNCHSYTSRFSGASAVLHVDSSGTIIEKHVPKIFIHQENIPLAHRYPKYQPPLVKNKKVDIEESHYGRKFAPSLSRDPHRLDDKIKFLSASDSQFRRSAKRDNFDNEPTNIRDSKIRYNVKTEFNPINSSNSVELQMKSPNSKEEVRNLRKRTEDARVRLGQQRIMLDRYLPLDSSNTSVQDEVQFRYGQLVEKMPHLEAYCRTRDKENKGKVIEPYEPVDMDKISKHRIGNYTVSNSFTPKISDTRRRARSVLCKVKGDPNYFNYQN